MFEEQLLKEFYETSLAAAGEIKDVVHGLTLDRRRKKSEPSQYFSNQYEIDVLADQIVHNHFENFDAFILSEERLFTNEDIEANDYVIIVDPIDGSSNASRGIGYWCYAAALLYKGEVISSVVVDQVGNRTFHADHLHASTMKDAQDRVVELNELPVNEDVGTLADGFSNALISFTTKEGLPIPFGHFRHLGASALAICDVAANTLDAYIDDEDILLRPWDLVAAEYIAKKAGCFVKRRDSQGVFAATGSLVTKSQGLLTAFENVFPNYFRN